MNMEVTFPGGMRVNAEYDGFTIETDQSEESGGDGSAPEPFKLFLASLATCAGVYVLGFCKARGISTEGIKLVQKHLVDPLKKGLSAIEIEIHVPKDFPEQYHSALVRAANMCAVKRTIQDPPEISAKTVVS